MPSATRSAPLELYTRRPVPNQALRRLRLRREPANQVPSILPTPPWLIRRVTTFNALLAEQAQLDDLENTGCIAAAINLFSRSMVSDGQQGV
jgi:hypothetical protein